MKKKKTNAKQQLLSDEVSDVLDFFKNVHTQYSKANINLSRLDMYHNDLLHKLENDELSYHEQAKIAQELTRTRRERRLTKNEIELLATVRDVIGDGQFKAQIQLLTKSLTEVKKIEKIQENWVYKNRVLNEPDAKAKGKKKK